MLTDLGLAVPVAIVFTVKRNADAPSIEAFLGRVTEAVNKLMELTIPAAFGFYTGSCEIIVWVANQQVADLFIKKKILIECCEEDVQYPMAPSVYIYCGLKRSIDIDRTMIVNYVRNVAADKFVDTYHQSMGILVELKTRESSEELLKNLEEVFELAIASFRIICTSEFTHINFYVLPQADHHDINDTNGQLMHCVEEYVKANQLGEVKDISLTLMLRSCLKSCSDHPAIIYAALGATTENGINDILLYCPTRFDQQILVKLQQIELGANGPILSLSKTIPTNGNGVTRPYPPQVEGAVTATDMILVHNIYKLLEETEENSNSEDSLNGIHTCNTNDDNDSGHVGDHSLAQSHKPPYPLLSSDLRAVDDMESGAPRPTGGEYYIFWDYRPCPVYKNENLCEIHANIVYSVSRYHKTVHFNDHMGDYRGLDRPQPYHPLTFTNYLLIPSNAKNINLTFTKEQLHHIRELDFKYLCYDTTSTSEYAIHQEVDRLFQSNEDLISSAHICLISDMETCSEMSALLRLEGFIDITAVSRNAAHGHTRCKSTLSRVISWDDVKHGTITILDETKQPASTAPFRIASASSEPTTKVSTNSKMSNINSVLVGMSLSALSGGPPPSTSISADSTVASKVSRNPMSSVNYGYEQQRHTIQLPNALVATYMMKYIQLHCDQVINVSYAQVTSKKSDINNLMKHANVVAIGTANSSIVIKNEGISAADVKVLYDHLLGVVNALIGTKVTMALVLWDMRHVDIIKKYSKFIDICTNCDCMCNFTMNIDNQVTVEILGQSANSLDQVRSYIHSLLPRQDNWSHKSSIPKYLQCQVDEICSQYAMIVQIIVTTVPSTTNYSIYRMWGFNELFDVGKQKIQDTLLHSDNSKGGTSKAVDHAPISNSVQAKFKHTTTGQFTFHDHEAGIFFVNFKDEFQAYILEVFSVTIQGLENFAYDTLNNNRESCAATSRIPTLKITLSGPTKTVQDCRCYLEQLHPKTLVRYQVYYPLVSLVKMKDIAKIKNNLESQLKQYRSTVNYADQDPLTADQGFVSIRTKPPINNPKLLKLPCDLVLTVCAPSSNRDQHDQLLHIESAFSSISSDYFTAYLFLPTNISMHKQLTVRSTRDDFVANNRLCGIKWLAENGVGEKGVMKLFAKTAPVIDKVCDTMTSKGAILLESVGRNQTANKQLQLKILNDIPFRGTGNISFSEEEYMPSPDGSQSRTSLASSLGSSPSKDSVSTKEKVLSRAFQDIIHWPIQSCRYVFLSEIMKTELANILEYFRRLDIYILSPYRSKHDPLACILVSSDQMKAVEMASVFIKEYFQRILKSMRSVALVVSDKQMDCLLHNDLILLKEVQGQYGTHIILEPSLEDMRVVDTLYDLRLPFTAIDSDELRVEEEILVTCRAPNPASIALNCEISVIISNPATGAGWSYGSNAILMIVDDSVSLGLTSDEDDVLRDSLVLVNYDEVIDKTILRVKIPANNGYFTWTYEQQVMQYIDAIKRGLSQADTLALYDIAVLPPNSLFNLSDLKQPELFKTLTINAIVEFVRTTSMFNLKHIECVDLMEESAAAVKMYREQVVPFPLLTHMDTYLKPCNGSVCATRLLFLLENSYKSSERYLSLVSLNMPVKFTAQYNGNTMLPSHLLPKKHNSCPVLVRGLPDQIMKSINKMKILFHQSK